MPILELGLTYIEILVPPAMENEFIIHLSIRPRFHGGGIDYRKNIHLHRCLNSEFETVSDLKTLRLVFTKSATEGGPFSLHMILHYVSFW